MRFFLRLFVSLALSALFLWLAFRHVSWQETVVLLRGVDPLYCLLFLLCVVTVHTCRMLRWGVLIAPFAQVPTRTLLRISGVGLMMILILPLRLGEFARPYLLKREIGTPMSSGLATILIERAIDGLLVTLLFFITTFSLDPMYKVPTSIRTAAIGSLALFASVTVVLCIAYFASDTMARWTRFLLGARFPALSQLVLSKLSTFVEGLRSLPSAKSLLSFIAWTLAYWAANGLSLVFAFKAFGWDLPWIAGYILVCVIVIGIMIPAGPGMLGTFQSAVTFGLAIFAVDPTAAAAYGLLVYPGNVLVVCAAGIIALMAGQSVGVGDLMKVKEES